MAHNPIEFANDLARFRRASHGLIVAAAGFFGPRGVARQLLGRIAGDAAAGQAMRLVEDASPGLLGTTVTTLVDAAPLRRLTVAVLPDRVSRHNAPSRAESIRKVVVAAGLGKDRNAILLVLDDPAHVLPAVSAVSRALPLFGRKTAGPARGATILMCADRQGRRLPVERSAVATACAARQAAELVDTPPTELDPAALAAAAKRMLRGTPGLRIQETKGDALLRAGLGGIHAVGRCARSAPRMLVATVKPARSKRLHVALVGKGVTYDTGGLHLKARGSMEGMKADMGGAAAVLGAFAVLARQKLPCRLSLVLCMAENAIGPAAYKPDDILTLHSGKTVEINNTDAEGRLLLADGVSWAARRLRADIVIDAATLTGAQLIATGNLHAAVVSNDEELERALLAAGLRSGDLTWPLPFAPEFYKSEFQSPVADMRNSVKNRSNAQSSCAAQFVHWHIEDTDVRWAHVDLAGPAFRDDRGTGYGVALLVEAVQALAAGPAVQSARRRAGLRRPRRSR
jgi:probable aminopeptidase NPEPL1